MTRTVTGATVPVAAVAAAGLGKVFEGSGSERVEALTDIDLSIVPGEFVSLIGPSAYSIPGTGVISHPNSSA